MMTKFEIKIIMRRQSRILNWRGELKRKIKFTKRSKTKKKSKSKEWGPYLKTIINHGYRFNDEIEKKSKFNKRTENKN
jgi:hypothetical protein